MVLTKTHEEGVSVEGELLFIEFLWHLDVLEDGGEYVFGGN